MYVLIYMNMYDFEVEFKLWILLITGIIKF